MTEMTQEQRKEVDALHPEQQIGKTLEQLETTIQNNQILIDALRTEIHELQDECKHLELCLLDKLKYSVATYD
jgi:hypothetical protein